MVNQIEKTAVEIKDRMTFWYLKYYNKKIEELHGKEGFTIYQLLDQEEQASIEAKFELFSWEKPVLVLRISKGKFIVNTTERFVNIDGDQVQVLNYSEFDRHNGYRQVVFHKKNKPISVKTSGYISDFEIRKKDGALLNWKVTTGTDGFGFWNVTAKCELVGRKFVNTNKWIR